MTSWVSFLNAVRGRVRAGGFGERMRGTSRTQDDGVGGEDGEVGMEFLQRKAGQYHVTLSKHGSGGGVRR